MDGTSSPVPGAASKFFPGFCSLGRVKVRDVQIGAWEVGVGGLEMGELEWEEPKGCPALVKEHGVPVRVLFCFTLRRDARERLLGSNCYHWDRIKGLTVESKSPETRKKATEWTVALFGRVSDRNCISTLNSNSP